MFVGRKSNTSQEVGDQLERITVFPHTEIERLVFTSEQAEKYWQSILLNDTEFSRQQELINAVNKITLESLRKYYELALLQKNRRLWLSTNNIDNPKDFDVITNIADYQQKQQGYVSP